MGWGGAATDASHILIGFATATPCHPRWAVVVCGGFQPEKSAPPPSLPSEGQWSWPCMAVLALPLLAAPPTAAGKDFKCSAWKLRPGKGGSVPAVCSARLAAARRRGRGQGDACPRLGHAWARGRAAAGRRQGRAQVQLGGDKSPSQAGPAWARPGWGRRAAGAWARARLGLSSRQVAERGRPGLKPGRAPPSSRSSPLSSS